MGWTHSAWRGHLLLAVLGVLLLALGPLFGSAASASHQFSDVDDDHLFHSDISWAANLGVAGGYIDGTFRPTDAVTRQGVVAFLHRLWLALGEDSGSPPDPGFSDVDDDHLFFDDISWAANLGVAGGYTDGLFRPTEAVTRQGVVAFLHRFFAKLAIEVNTAADTVDVGPGDGICADANEECSLRAAIIEANALPGADLIVVTPDLAPIDLQLAGIAEDSSATGDLDVTDDLVILGNDATVNAAGLDRVLHVHSASLELVEIELTGGATTSDGGGIHNDDGTLAIISSNISNNSAGLYGGGIYNDRGGSSPTGSATITDSMISSNSADFGGGIYSEGADLSIIRSTVSGNSADRTGGGVYAFGNILLTRSLSIANSTISDNDATVGGGVYLDFIAAAIANSTVSGNRSQSSGGVIGAGGGIGVGESSLTLRSSTVFGNTASSGSAIQISVESSVSVGGSVLSGPGGDCSGSVSSIGFNASDDLSCGLTHAADQMEVAPLLGPLADNGGSTLTHVAFSNSPLLDRIPVGTPELCDESVPVDQRGELRPAGDACDIGAVERQVTDP